MTEPPETPSAEKLAAILDPAHGDRIRSSPGPIVLLRSPGEGRSGEALSVPDYLLHPARTVRDSAIRYLLQAPNGPSSWLSPRSQATISETAEVVRSELLEEWLPAARRLFDVLEGDFLLNLAGMRQCWTANLREEHATYWRRVIRPGIHLSAYVPTSWYEIPPPEGAAACVEECVTGATSVAEALERYFARYGHLPLAPPASAGSIVRRWVESAGDRTKTWDEVWQWCDSGSSPLRAYHACQTFLECHDLVPDGQLAEFWRRVRTLCSRRQQEEGANAEQPPDLLEIEWELRVNLARHYLGQLELHTPEPPGDRLAALAWWASERVATELADCLRDAGAEIAPTLLNVLDRRVGPEAELTEVEWDVLRPARPSLTFAFGTMEARSFWIAALLAGPASGVQLPSDAEPWVAINLLGASLGGFPPPGNSATSGQLVFGRDFDAAAAEWAIRIGTEENRKFLLDVIEIRREIAAGGELPALIRAIPDAEPPRQAVVCNAFRSLAALGTVQEDNAWRLLGDNEWIRGAFTRLESGPLQGLLWGLMEIQRREAGRWRWTLPRLLCSLADVSNSERGYHVFSDVGTKLEFVGFNEAVHVRVATDIFSRIGLTRCRSDPYIPSAGCGDLIS